MGPKGSTPHTTHLEECIAVVHRHPIASRDSAPYGIPAHSKVGYTPFQTNMLLARPSCAKGIHSDQGSAISAASWIFGSKQASSCQKPIPSINLEYRISDLFPMLYRQISDLGQ
jgi:hypothetical protein